MEQLSVILGFTILSMIVTALYAPLLIKLLYKMQIVVRHSLMGNKMNEEFIKIQGHKTGTPTLGGLMISISVLVLGLVFLPENNLKLLFLIFWGLFTLYGLIEGLIVYARKLSDKFKLLESSFEWRMGKLFVLYLICLMAVAATCKFLAIDQIELFGITIIINTLSVFIGAFFFVLAMYAMEITDGADGLVTGQFLIAIISYVVISMLTGKTELVPILGLILGSSIVYLYFNINPARVFMGGTGTFPIAFAILISSIITNTVDIFLIIGIIFWIELGSSALQILWIKLFKKRLFKIAPFHHYFESVGWPETKMVQRFWLFSAIFALVGLWIFSLIK